MCSDWLITGVVKYTEVFCYNKATTVFNLLFFFFFFFCKERMALHTLAGCSVRSKINIRRQIINNVALAIKWNPLLST